MGLQVKGRLPLGDLADLQVGSYQWYLEVLEDRLDQPVQQDHQPLENLVVLVLKLLAVHENLAGQWYLVDLVGQ